MTDAMQIMSQLTLSSSFMIKNYNKVTYLNYNNTLKTSLHQLN